MTEKTDIDALRSEAANIIGLLTAAGHEALSLDKTADFFDDVFRLLEAECQQRAAAEITSESYKNILGVAIKELAALRGEQEPVAWTDAEELRDVEKHGCGYLFKIDPANPYTDPRRQIMVYRRQPKPVVVLPEKSINDCNRYNIDYQDTVKALEAAGIVVRDGE